MISQPSHSVMPDWPYLAASNQISVTASRVATLGINSDVDTASQPEDVWSASVLGTLNGIDHKLIQIPAAATSMEVVSSSTDDTAAGTGARTMVVNYLDSAWDAKSTIITLNGTTPVAMPENVMRINTAIVLTSGTRRGNNLGAISIRATGGAGATYGYLEIGDGLHKSSLFSVPNGKTFDLISVLSSINRTDTADRWASFQILIQNESGRLLRTLEWAHSSDLPYRHESAGLPLNVLTQKTDIWICCHAVSTNNTNVTGGLFGILR